MLDSTVKRRSSAPNTYEIRDLQRCPTAAADQRLYDAKMAALANQRPGIFGGEAGTLIGHGDKIIFDNRSRAIFVCISLRFVGLD